MRLQIVHFRVNDAETSKPTPCRIRITDPNGQEYAPLGRPLEFSCNRGEDVGGHCRIGKKRWFSIDGACEIALPPGELRVQVRKGINYVPIDEVIHQPTGKMAIRLTLQPGPLVLKPYLMTIDMRCHDAPPSVAQLDGAGEGLDVVNLLAHTAESLGQDGNTYQAARNLLSFSGQSQVLGRFATKVFVNTHNRHPILGCLALLNSHRPVFPLAFGGADSFDDWSLHDWTGQCHRKGGLVIWTDPFQPGKPHAGEALALAILGKIDAVEVTPNSLSYALPGWYHLLNAGIHLPLVGASGRCDNKSSLGSLQTIAYHDDGDWVARIKNGYPSVSNGPHVCLVINENKAHASVVAAYCPFSQLELVADGKVVAKADAVASPDIAGLWCMGIDFDITNQNWFAARVIDPRPSPHTGMLPTFGHTSAEYLGRRAPAESAIEFLSDHLDRGADWVENHGRFEQPKFKKQLLDTFAEAKATLMSGKRS